MGRGNLSDVEWELIGPLLPPERGLRAITGLSSMECFTCCGSAVPGATCMSDTASGTPFTCASVAEPNRVSGMPCCKHWSI